jgi:hypothetical protein
LLLTAGSSLDVPGAGADSELPAASLIQLIRYYSNNFYQKCNPDLSFYLKPQKIKEKKIQNKNISDFKKILHKDVLNNLLR